MSRVSYIWSEELQAVSDQLPSNIGRSSVVHDLIDAFGLLHHARASNHDGSESRVVQEAKDGQDGQTDIARASETSLETDCRAKVVSPDLDLGTATMMKRYHDVAYVEYLMHPLKRGSGGTDSDGSGSTDESESSFSDDRPAKRRKTHGLEYAGHHNWSNCILREFRPIASNASIILLAANQYSACSEPTVYDCLYQDCPPFAALPSYAQLVAAATITACREIVENRSDTSIVWDGGRHHALRNRASGFCYVADIVLGILYLVKHGSARSVRSVGVASTRRPDGLVAPRSGNDTAQKDGRTTHQGSGLPDTVETAASTCSNAPVIEQGVGSARDGALVFRADMGSPPAQTSSDLSEKMIAAETTANTENAEQIGTIAYTAKTETTETPKWTKTTDTTDTIDTTDTTETTATAATTTMTGPAATTATTDKPAKPRRPRVMYLDLDIHEGDGVHQAFLSPSHFLPAGQQSTTKVRSDPTPPSSENGTAQRPCRPSRPPRSPRPPQVLTLSIHHHAPTFFPPHRPFSSLPKPDTLHPFTLSIPLHAYPSPLTYAAVWPSVEAVKEAFDPDYIVLQLGVDGLPGDRVGQYGSWAITGEGGLGWCLDKVRQWGLGTVVTGGGGYDHPNAARAWAMATSILLGRLLNDDEPIPHHEHFPLYAPSFSLGISPSHAKDENTAKSISKINETFGLIASRIKGILAAHA